MTLQAAANRAHVSYAAVRNWLLKGSGEMKCPDNRPYVDFVKAIEQAAADLQSECLEAVHRAKDGGVVVRRTVTTRPDGSEQVAESYSAPQYQAATWLLEAKWRQYRRKTEHKLSGTVRNLNVNVSANLSESQIVQAMALLGMLAQQNENPPALLSGGEGAIETSAVETLPSPSAGD